MLRTRNNALLLRQRFYFIVEGGRWSTFESETVPNGLFLQMLQEAERVMQNGLRIRINSTVAVDCTSGTIEYAAPANLFGQAIHGIAIADENDAYKAPLNFIDYEKARSEYGIADGTPTVGTPKAWCWDPTNPRQFLLCPKPDVTRSMMVRYTRMLDPIRRLWIPDSVTGAITKGLKALVLSADPGDEFVVATDDIGIVDKAGAIPWTFYEIDTKATVTQTLMEAYEAETETVGVVMSAQVPDIELAYPGSFGMALCDYAVGLFYQGSKPDLSDKFFDRAMKVRDAWAPDDNYYHEGDPPPTLPGVNYARG